MKAALLGLLLAILAGSAFASDFPNSPQADPKAPQPGVKTCLRCHDKPEITSILHSPHGVTGDSRTHFADEGCETCHGPSVEHQRRPAEGEKRARPDVVFGKDTTADVATRNQVCLNCHEGGLRMNWHGSQHESSDLACTSCHTSHVVKDPVLVKATQGPVCFTCHAAQRAQSMKPSHHPILEGKVACSDCHNPHGSAAPALLSGINVTDTCLTCHAEKRGPFLFDHPPVREDCGICHNPHGSTQASLLKERVPYLCESCHDSSSHNSTPFNGNNLISGKAPAREFLLRSCLNCHTEVHGSNHPSGVRFER